MPDPAGMLSPGGCETVSARTCIRFPSWPASPATRLQLAVALGTVRADILSLICSVGREPGWAVDGPGRRAPLGAMPDMLITAAEQIEVWGRPCSVRTPGCWRLIANWS